MRPVVSGLGWSAAASWLQLAGGSLTAGPLSPQPPIFVYLDRWPGTAALEGAGKAPRWAAGRSLAACPRPIPANQFAPRSLASLGSGTYPPPHYPTSHEQQRHRASPPPISVLPPFGCTDPAGQFGTACRVWCADCCHPQQANAFVAFQNNKQKMK